MRAPAAMLMPQGRDFTSFQTEFTDYERFSSNVKASPIARSDYEAEAGVGFVHRFWMC